MAILQLLSENPRFEDKGDKERDLILRDCQLALFLDNELLTQRVDALERKIVILQNKCKVSFL